MRLLVQKVAGNPALLRSFPLSGVEAIGNRPPRTEELRKIHVFEAGS